MARGPAILLSLALLAGCSKPAANTPRPNDPHLPAAALDQYIAEGIGDPSTCVLLADPATGKVLYRYGELFNCVRGLPACDRPGDLTATVALKMATPTGRAASCASVPDGSRTVGWTEGLAAGTKRPLIYSAVMEGQRALPGREMAARLGDAFSSAGL